MTCCSAKGTLKQACHFNYFVHLGAMTGPRTDEWAAYVRGLGLELSRLRTAAGLSQERVANAAGLTRGYYHQLEKGESRAGRIANPTLLNLIALAQVLGTSLNELLPRNPPDMRAGR